MTSFGVPELCILYRQLLWQTNCKQRSKSSWRTLRFRRKIRHHIFIGRIETHLPINSVTMNKWLNVVGSNRHAYANSIKWAHFQSQLTWKLQFNYLQRLVRVIASPETKRHGTCFRRNEKIFTTAHFKCKVQQNRRKLNERIQRSF